MMSTAPQVLTPTPAPPRTSAPTVQGRELRLSTARWVTLRGTPGIRAIANEWDELARRFETPPTADATWMRCFWAAFSEAHDADLRIDALYYGAQLAGVFPVHGAGRLWPVWRSVANGHAPCVSFAAGAPCDDIAGAMLDHFLAEADGVDLERVQADGTFTRALVEAAEERGLSWVSEQRPGDLVLPVHASWELQQQTLAPNIARDTPRKLRKLSALGAVQLRVVADALELTEWLPRCFELETRGWKGQRGAPIMAKPGTHRFYTELAESAARQRRFALYILLCGTRLVAFEYCLRGHGRIDMLKLSFEPELARVSPGNVLRYLILEHEARRGEVQTYHFGADSEWKRRWARDVDPLIRLRIYRRGWHGRLTTGAVRLRNQLKRQAWLRQGVLAARRLGIPGL